MKISEASNQFPDFPQQKKVKEKPASGAARSVKGPSGSQELEFKETFFSAAETAIKSSLDELMAGVQAQGERLARHQNFEQLSKYKDLVQAFLAKASKDLYRLQISDGGRPQPGGKIYVILEKVDVELEKLTKLVLAGQTPQLRILEKLDQIKGLLLDAYK
jgi:uncharacterized protein YaaR (DUF327 family)